MAGLMMLKVYFIKSHKYMNKNKKEINPYGYLPINKSPSLTQLQRHLLSLEWRWLMKIIVTILIGEASGVGYYEFTWEAGKKKKAHPKTFLNKLRNRKNLKSSPIVMLKKYYLIKKCTELEL